MNILKTAKMNDLFGKGFGTFYIEDQNISVHRYDRSIRIKDLENALCRGKDVGEVSVNFFNDGEMPFVNYICDRFDGDFKKLFNLVKSNAVKSGCGFDVNVTEEFGLENQQFDFYYSEHKGVREFSPFALDKLKPLKKEPAKWTIPNVIKALVNGQFENLRCTGKYTDDYAFDAAYNFQQGEVKNVLGQVKDLIEDGGSQRGWWVYKRDDGEVKYSQHHFQGFAFTFKKNQVQKLAA